jgi:hypothetical protein
MIIPDFTSVLNLATTPAALSKRARGLGLSVKLKERMLLQIGRPIGRIVDFCLGVIA